MKLTEIEWERLTIYLDQEHELPDQIAYLFHELLTDWREAIDLIGMFDCPNCQCGICTRIRIDRGVV